MTKHEDCKPEPCTCPPSANHTGNGPCQPRMCSLCGNYQPPIGCNVCDVCADREPVEDYDPDSAYNQNA